MAIREAKANDLAAIMTLIHQAQAYFKEQGIDQWQDNYPTEEVILADIHNHESYVFVVEEKVVATMTLTFIVQPEYGDIRGEEWTINSEYATIHRLAVDELAKGQGLASRMLSFAARKCLLHQVKSLRTDTYEKNISMQRSLLKNGFQQKGIVKRSGVADMIAFEKIIK